MEKGETAVLEARLVKELADIKKRIEDLRHEYIATERMLLRVKREGVAINNVTRRDSVNRAVVESEIIRIIKSYNDRPVSASVITRGIRSIDRGINDSTIRSYIHRMKEKGLIRSARHGFWQIAKGGE